MSVCPWLGLCLGLPEPWPLWDIVPAGLFCPSPRYRCLLVPGYVTGPLRRGGGVLCRVLCGSWAPGALESYQGARCLWFSRTLTLWPWAPHLGPTSFSCLDERTDVWSQVFGTPGGCGWRGCPVSISVCLWPWVWGQAPTLIKYICDKDIHRLTLSLSFSHIHTHTIRTLLIYVCVYFPVFGFQVLFVC